MSTSESWCFFNGLKRMDGMEDNQTQKVIVTKVKPKHIPLVCPTCKGFGTLKYGAKVCNGCDGKTYILVQAEEVK